MHGDYNYVVHITACRLCLELRSRSFEAELNFEQLCGSLKQPMQATSACDWYMRLVYAACVCSLCVWPECAARAHGQSRWLVRTSGHVVCRGLLMAHGKHVACRRWGCGTAVMGSCLRRSLSVLVGNGSYNLLPQHAVVHCGAAKLNVAAGA